jgi:sugar phosphate isomerase/epimerase
MQIAIQEDMLPGRSMMEKFENAKRLGIHGVEFWGRGLSGKVRDIVEAMEATGIVAAAVNHGRQSRFLDPDPIERDIALTELRQSMTDAADIRAKGVIFVPHFFGPLLPDLTPYKSAMELEFELLIAHLRTLEDLADAMDIELYVEPVNRYETHFLNRLEQAAAVSRNRNHPRVKIVADLFHMSLDESDMVKAIQDHANDIGHVHLADSNRRLPGQGLTDFGKMAAALNEIGYNGWAAYECGEPGDNQVRAKTYMDEFPASLGVLKQAGFF